MSVSQVNGGTPHFSRRRRKGGSGRRIPGDPPNASTSSAGRGGNVSSGNGAIVVTAGGGRGGGRRTIWEDNTATGRPGTTAKLSDDHDGQPSAVSRTGGASAGGDMQGSRAGGGVGVHPAMLESEFLAATGAAEAGEEGGAVSLSLEEVPYDRDVRWCNTASDSRPRPKMDTSGGVYGRVGAPIAQDTGDYERLDRHYQELWKARQENGPPAAGRGRGGRATRGGGRGRGGRGSGGGRNGGGPRGPSVATSRRGGAAADSVPATRRGNLGGGGGVAGRGSGRSPASKGGGSPVVRGGEGGVAADVDSACGGVGAGGRKRNQRSVNSKTPAGRGGGPGGVNGVAHSSPSRSSQQHQAMSPPAYHVLGPPPGRGHGSPYLQDGRLGWEGQDRRGAPGGRDPWAGAQVGSSSRSQRPIGAVAAAPPLGENVQGFVSPRDGLSMLRTPPLVPALPSLLGGLPSPDSPELYLGDLASALSSTPSPPRVPSSGGREPAATTPPLGPTLFGAMRNGGSAGSYVGGVMSNNAQNGSAATLSSYWSPSRSTDIRLLGDPSLDVDIQDICADPDLNADAPAFVPGGYIFPA